MLCPDSSSCRDTPRLASSLKEFLIYITTAKRWPLLISASFGPSAVRVITATVYSGRREAGLVMASIGKVNPSFRQPDALSTDTSQHDSWPCAGFGSWQDWCGVWISLWFCVWTRRHRLDAARQTSRHHEHQLCLPAFLVPLGGGHPERLFAKSEPSQNRWDAPSARNLSSELDCAGRSSLTAKIHFFSTDVTRCLALCKVRLLPRDFPSITVRWACK